MRLQQKLLNLSQKQNLKRGNKNSCQRYSSLSCLFLSVYWKKISRFVDFQFLLVCNVHIKTWGTSGTRFRAGLLFFTDTLQLRPKPHEGASEWNTEHLWPRQTSAPFSFQTETQHFVYLLLMRSNRVCLEKSNFMFPESNAEGLKYFLLKF